MGLKMLWRPRRKDEAYILLRRRQLIVKIRKEIEIQHLP
jgi:hypothetical protein